MHENGRKMSSCQFCDFWGDDLGEHLPDWHLIPDASTIEDMLMPSAFAVKGWKMMST